MIKACVVSYMPAALHIPLLSPVKEHVIMIWEVKGDRNVKETILPQGAIEIIFNFAQEVNGLLPFGTALKAPRCFLQGMLTLPLHADYTGEHHLLGIRLHPHRVKEMFGITPAELSNTNIDLSLLDPTFNSIWHQLAALDRFADKVVLLESTLPFTNEQGCERSQYLSELFFKNDLHGFQNVDELAKEICYSTRQLNRIIQEQYGVSAEELTTYKKYMEAVKLMHSTSSPLTAIGYSAGFYDQAHFCRVFKQYAGMTANQYRKIKSFQPFHLFA